MNRNLKFLYNFAINNHRIFVQKSQLTPKCNSNSNNDFAHRWTALFLVPAKSDSDTNRQCVFIHSSRAHQNTENNIKFRFAIAAPTFLAFFKKQDADEEEPSTFLEKLIPINIRLIFRKNEEENTPEGKLIMTIKRSILCIQQNQMKRAEQMIHLALRMAQDMHSDDGITLCYDIMANLAMEREQFEKAEELFVAVLKRLLQNGTAQDDIKVLHISLKIAQMSEYRSLFEKAEQGYRWVINTISAQLKAGLKDDDLYELFGLAHDCLGKFLLHTDKLTEARESLKESYNIYTQLHGKNDPQVVDLLNNLAVVCTHLNDLPAAELYINEAIKLARHFPDLINTGIYHANQGLLFLKKGLLPEAMKACTYSHQTASKNDHPDGIAQAKYCLEQLKAATKG